MGTRLGWFVMLVLIVGGLTWLMKPVLGLFIGSLAVAYLLDPVVDRFEARGYSREAGIGVLAVTATLISLALLGVVIPAVALEVQDLAVAIPGYVAVMSDWYHDTVVRIELATGAELPDTFGAVVANLQAELLGTAPVAEPLAEDPGGLSDALKDAAPNVGKAVAGFLTSALAGGLSFVLAVVNLALVPIFVFYLLKDWDRLVAAVDRMVPPRHRARVRRLSREIDMRTASFVRGQLTVCCVLAVLYSIGLLFTGIDMAIAVGVTSGLLFIVPYLGTVVGIVAASVLALVKFGVSGPLIGVWATFATVQFIEGTFLTPKIMGEQVGLHPLVVMIALLVGGDLMGLWGMLVAIPITAAGQVLLFEWMGSYYKSGFFEDT